MGVESWSGVPGSLVEGGAGELPASTRVFSTRGLSARGLSAQGLSTQGLHAEVLPWLMAVADPGEGWWERRRRNPKRMGEVSQAAFLLKAWTLGFGVAVPWGDSEKYDFIVWAGRGGRLLRVQVKA